MTYKAKEETILFAFWTSAVCPYEDCSDVRRIFPAIIAIISIIQ